MSDYTDVQTEKPELSLKNPDKAMRPVAFWFLNHRLEESELIRQIREMDQQGLGGFMLHARDGLRTTYLGEDWEHALRICIEEAEKRGMEVWLYDENHYPSGPAGGLLPCRHPDRTMKSMAVLAEQRYQAGEPISLDIPRDCFETLVGWGQRAKNAKVPLSADEKNLVLLTSLATGQVLDVSEAAADGVLNIPSPFPEDPSYLVVLRVLSFAQVSQAIGKYQYPYYPDAFDEDLTDEFIGITHRWYEKRFGQYFGGTIKGIFADNYSPNFGFLRRSVPWGRNFANRFREDTGRDIKDILPALFCRDVPDARTGRMVYWRFMGRAFQKSYYERIGAYCASVGLLSTGHLCLEDGMAEHARQIGDYFDVMRSFSMTAVDQLGPREKGGDLSGSLNQSENLSGCIKNTASAALWQDSPRVMCESFGCASAPWGLDLGEMNRISGWLFGLGVDLFVPHGLYYSIAGNRKWECTPDHLHHPQWNYYRVWTDWISRLCSCSVGGIPLSEVAVLYPIHSLRAELEMGLISEADRKDPSCSGHGTRTNAIQRCYRWTLEALIQQGINFETIDETTLGKSAVNGTTLAIPLKGKDDSLVLKAVILPGMTVLEPTSQRLLAEFVDSGGLVICINDSPFEIFDAAQGQRLPEDGRFMRLHEIFLNTSIRNGQLPTNDIRAINVALDHEHVQCGELLFDILEDTIERPLIFETSVQKNTSLITRSWHKNGMRFHYLFNGATVAANVDAKVSTTAPLTLIDCTDGSRVRLQKNAFHRLLESGEGLLLAEEHTDNLPLENSLGEIRERHILETTGWGIKPDRWNVFPLRTWATDFSGKKCRCTIEFSADVSLKEARLLMDLERSLPELDSHFYGGRFECKLNGTVISDFRPGTYLDRNIYEAKIGGRLIPGVNVLEISSEACLIDHEWRLHPPMIIGNFALRKNETQQYSICASPHGDLTTGPWHEQGFPFFSGEFHYHTDVDIPALKPDERLFLECESVAGSAALLINGKQIACRVNPPWRFEIGRFSGQHVDLEIRVANTPHNTFQPAPVEAGLLGQVAFTKHEGKQQTATTNKL
jgi:hypothetical protein